MKKYTWKELREIQQQGRDKNYKDLLKEIPEKYQLAFALALSLVKWERETLARGMGYCALCDVFQLYLNTCPLYLKHGKRHCPSSATWCNWVHSPVCSKEREKFADKIYNMLVECYREEYAKI